MENNVLLLDYKNDKNDKETCLSRVVAQLENMFGIYNDHFYGGVLVKPVITVSPSKRAYGHFTIYKTWTNTPRQTISDQDNGYYEINLGAEYVARDITEVSATLLHEMVHLFCRMNGLRDTSNNYYYHNETFKAVGESHGLILKFWKHHGWTLTELNEEARKFVLGLNLPPLTLYRKPETEIVTTGNADAGTDSNSDDVERKPKFKMVCPKCDIKFTFKRPVRLLCLDCGCELKIRDVYNADKL